MKVLLVHNFYGSSAPSGENAVYDAERALLMQNGHEVIEFTRNSDDIRRQGVIGLLKGAFATPWNLFSTARLRRMLACEKPDIMHVHNTFPLISPAAFHTTSGLPTATVLTLHNYRSFCAAGIPERRGVPCTECLDRKDVFPAILHGCYRGSRLATLPLALMIGLHRALRTWSVHVDAFISLTGFQKNKLAVAGLPMEKMHVKPHFYADPPQPLPWLKREARAVYVGRLGEYKGVHVLINAWNIWGDDAPVLDIIGDGPERNKLEAMADGNPRINFTGQLSFSDAQARLAMSKLLILPSLCFEGFPMVIRESFALGVPVIGSRLGSIPCIVEDGKSGSLFEPGDSEDLCGKIKYFWENDDRLQEMGEVARREFELKYTVATNYSLLMKIYESAIQQRFRRLKVEQ